MEREELRGHGNEMKGELKDTVGGITGDRDMQAEGKMDKVKGKVQEAYGRVKENLKGDKDKK